MKRIGLVVTLLFGSIGMVISQNIVLVPPSMEGGKTVMEALMLRSSHRDFNTTPLSDEHLSGLLWSACGINRPESGKRTAPSARNWQDVSLYVFLEQGIYRYNEAAHTLELLKQGDHRKAAGVQDFVFQVPVNIVLVSDYEKMTGASEKDMDRYAGLSAGYISQNIYLYAASEGLNTVVRAMLDKDELHKLLELKPSQHVIVAQSVGYKADTID